jgi:hypothetical protein
MIATVRKDCVGPDRIRLMPQSEAGGNPTGFGPLRESVSKKVPVSAR